MKPPRRDTSGISGFLRDCFRIIPQVQSLRILDAPCGYGRHTLWLAARGHQVVAVDRDPDCTQEVRSRAENSDCGGRVQCVVADIDKTMPFDIEFDAVLMVHYFSLASLRIVSSAVRPGGHFLFESVPNHGGNWKQLPQGGLVVHELTQRFEILEKDERSVGPADSNAVFIRLLARRYQT